MVKKPLGFLLRTGPDSAPIPIYEDDITSMGRDDINSIILEDLAASRRHASIEGRMGHIYITDLDSSTGTFIDELRINPHERVKLLSGQEIRIGGKLFYVISADMPPEAQERVKKRADLFTKRNTLRALKTDRPNVTPGVLTTQKLTPLKTPTNLEPLQTPLKTPVAQPAPQTVTTNVSLSKRARFSTRITRRMTRKISKKIPKPPDTAVHTLSGDVSAGGLPNIIQMINTRRFSGIMKVSGNDETATILFLNGDLYAAFRGKQSGIEAIYTCALETNTKFAFDKLEPSAVEITPRNITRGTMMILMDCCQMIHEAMG